MASDQTANEAAIGLYHKIGFKTEEMLPDHYFFHGKHHDALLLAFTNEEPTTPHSAFDSCAVS